MNLELLKENLGEKFSRDADFLNSIVTELELTKDSKILDIGTGWGFMAITLALHGYDVITGEPEHAKWADWRSKAKIVNVEDKITFKPFYAENLPFDNSSFDVIFLYTSLHHIQDKNQSLNEILRVLKQNGQLIIIELTEEAVKLIRQRHIDHPETINPKEFTKNYDLEVTTKESKYLIAYIYQRNHKY